MTGQESHNPQNIAKEVDALRENFGAETKSTNALQWLVFGLIFIIIIVAAIWALRPEPADRPVLIFNAGIALEDADASFDWMPKATQQSLNSYLDIGEQIHIINSAQTAASYTPPKSDSDWILSGILSPNESTSEQVTLNIKLQSRTNSRKIFQAQLAGVSTGLSDLSARASAQIYTWLKQQPLTANESQNARAELPLNIDAQAAYAKGYEALSAYDSQRARGFFNTALDLGGDHPMVYNGLARVYDHMGLRREAKAAHIKAYESREGLSRSRQLELEAFYLSATGKKKRAREVFTALKEFHPHDMGYRLHIASIYNLGSKADLAMAELDEARTLPKPFRNDPRIDLEEARTWYQLGHYEKGRDAARRAADKARNLGDKGLLAEALLNSGNADPKLYLEQLLEARALYEEIGNPDKLAGVLTSIGNHEKDSGHLKKAEDYFKEAIQISQDVGNEPRVFFVKNSLAIVMDLQGRLEDGLAMKREVLDYYLQVNIKVRSSIMLENINISLFKLGRLEEAETVLDQALIAFTDINDSIGVAWTPMYRGRIRANAGNLSAAENLARQALENSEKNPEGGLKQEARYLLAEIKFWRGQYDDASAEFKAIETAFTEANNAIHAADARHMLARIALRGGNFELAKTQLSEAEKTYLEADSRYYVLDTQITKTDIAFLEESQDIKIPCQTLDSRIKEQEYANIVLRARARQAQCRYRLGGPLETAIDALLTVEQDSAKLGLFEPQLEARIIRARLDGTIENLVRSETTAISKGWDVNWALP